MRTGASLSGPRHLRLHDREDRRRHDARGGSLQLAGGMRSAARQLARRASDVGRFTDWQERAPIQLSIWFGASSGGPIKSPPANGAGNEASAAMSISRSMTN